MEIGAQTVEWHEFYSHRIGLSEYLENLATHALLIEEIVKTHPQKILEIGTGTGSFSIFLSHLRYDVTSLDNNGKVLKIAEGLCKQLNAHVQFTLGDAFKLSKLFAPKGFDVVFSQGFFEHFTDDEINKLLREQLKVGKNILLSVPSKYYLRRERGDERLLSLQDWKKILANFNVVDIHYYGSSLLAWRWALKSLVHGKLPRRRLRHILARCTIEEEL